MSDPSVRGQDHLSAYQLRASDSSQSKKGRRRKGSLHPPLPPPFPACSGLRTQESAAAADRRVPSGGIE